MADTYLAWESNSWGWQCRKSMPWLPSWGYISAYSQSDSTDIFLKSFPQIVKYLKTITGWKFHQLIHIWQNKQSKRHTYQKVLPQFFCVRSISFGENWITFLMLITGRALGIQISMSINITIVINVEWVKQTSSCTCRWRQSQRGIRQPGRGRSSYPGPCCLPENNQTASLLKACQIIPKEKKVHIFCIYFQKKDENNYKNDSPNWK